MKPKESKMFILSESRLPLAPREIAEFETVGDALAKLDTMGPVCIEEDADHPNHFDAFMRDGRLMTIEPKKA